MKIFRLLLLSSAAFVVVALIVTQSVKAQAADESAAARAYVKEFYAWYLPPVGKRNRAKGSVKPGHTVAGTVTMAQIRKIAETKMKDLNANSIEAAMQVIIGAAKSCGLEVKG